MKSSIQAIIWLIKHSHDITANVTQHNNGRIYVWLYHDISRITCYTQHRDLTMYNNLASAGIINKNNHKVNKNIKKIINNKFDVMKCRYKPFIMLVDECDKIYYNMHDSVGGVLKLIFHENYPFRSIDLTVNINQSGRINGCHNFHSSINEKGKNIGHYLKLDNANIKTISLPPIEELKE